MRIFSALAIIATCTGGSAPAGPSKKSKARRSGRLPSLQPRDAIVRSVLLAHPTWNAGEVYRAAAPLIAAAGYKPVSADTVRHDVAQMAKQFNMPRPGSGFRPEHVAYLKAQYASNPKQTPSEVWNAFCLAWGPTAEDADRVTNWWYNTRRTHARRQRAADAAVSRAAALPADADPDLPAEWWNWGAELDQYVSTDTR